MLLARGFEFHARDLIFIIINKVRKRSAVNDLCARVFCPSVHLQRIFVHMQPHDGILCQHGIEVFRVRRVVVLERKRPCRIAGLGARDAEAGKFFVLNVENIVFAADLFLRQLIDHQHAVSPFAQLSCKIRTGGACTDDDHVVPFHSFTRSARRRDRRSFLFRYSKYIGFFFHCQFNSAIFTVGGGAKNTDPGGVNGRDRFFSCLPLRSGAGKACDQTYLPRFFSILMMERKKPTTLQ